MLIFDYEPEYYADLWKFAQKVARAQRRAIPCLRIGVGVLGLEVPHAHIHLIPLQSEKDLSFQKEKMHLPNDEMKAIADSIAKEYEKEK